MKVKVKIGSVKLNAEGHYEKNIIIENENGELLCIDSELFSISFNNKNELNGVSIINVYDKFEEEL